MLLVSTELDEILALADRIVVMCGGRITGTLARDETDERQLVAMREAGKAILLVSVELDEIRALSDRILVMCGGRITGERSAEADEREIGMLMAGMGEAA